MSDATVDLIIIGGGIIGGSALYHLAKIGYTPELFAERLAGKLDVATIGDLRWDRIEDRSEAYRQRVRDGFLAAAGSGSDPGAARDFYPAPVVLIDAQGDPDTVFAQIRSEVERVLALSPRP